MKLPGLSQGQGAAAARDPADRPRGGARAGAPRLASRSGTSARCSTRVSPRSATRSSTSASCPARASSSSSRSRSGCGRRPSSASSKGLEVGKAEAEVPDDASRRELERLREGFAEPRRRSSARPPPGDAVVIDFSGNDRRRAVRGLRGAATSLIELGSEQLLPEFDDRAHRRRRRRRAHGRGHASPTTTGPSTWPGKTAVLRGHRQGGAREAAARARRRLRLRGVGVRDARRAARRDAPPARARALEQRAEDEFREAAVDAVAANAKLEIPHELVHARAHEMWERIERQLASRGIDPQAYAQMQGKSRHDLIDDAEEDAERALRREAVLAAVADAEGIEPTDEELVEALGPGEGKNDPRKLLDRLRESRPRRAAARRDPDAQGRRRGRRRRRSRSRWSAPPPASRSGPPRRARPRTTTRPVASATRRSPASCGRRAPSNRQARFYTLTHR